MNAVTKLNVLDIVAGTVASTLKIPVGKLDIDANFDSFGMDSIIAMEFMTKLGKQLGMSITPAQLTSVNSIRELAAAIDGWTSDARPLTPTRTLAAAAAYPVQSVVKAVARVQDGPELRTPRALPRSSSAGSLRQILQFVKNEYGLDLRGERFASKQAVIDYLAEHHAETLSRYFGLSARAESDAAAVAPAPATPRAGQEVAIVGMACRFADAPTPNALWQNLIDGRSSIKGLAADRWPHRGAGAAGAARWGALIDDVDGFDPAFFGLTEKEAILIDPQERLVMLELYHALQNAGIRADQLRGSRTALFLGYEYAEYEHYLRGNLHRLPEAPAFSSSSPIYYLANRISFLYDFKGPSEVVNASCASSALAIHRACQSLAQGECDLAIAGGVSLNLFADDYAAISRYGLLSPDGSCAVFDDNANGFTRGEGLGLLVLKRVSDAERDRNRIFAKVIATHQNNRGRAAFISEIKHEAITQVINECYEKHAIAPGSVRYVEVDGYSTKWGDSFEFEGIKNAFQRDATGGKYCALGSIKGNIGHVEPASGVASAIKLALSLHHRRFPATITKKTLSTFIDVENKSHPLYIADRALPFEALRRQDEAIRAGMNSFSDSGINVHLLLEEYRPQREAVRGAERHRQLFIYSARTPEALSRYVDRHAEHLRTAAANGFEDLAYTMQLATEPMERRLAVIAASHAELIQLLARAQKLLAEGKSADGKGPIFLGNVPQRDGRLLDVIKAQITEEKLLENLRSGQLDEIALLWTSGIDIPWNAHWSEIGLARRQQGAAPPQIVDIPPYPFANTSYWPDFAPAAAVREEAAPQAVSDRATPRVDAQPVTPEWRFAAGLNGSANPQGQSPEATGAEEKMRLFIVQETAGLLRIAPAAVDEAKNFLELGFDSMAMATLIQRLIGLLGENISPSIVFKYQDIQRLGDHLAGSYRDKIDRIQVFRETAPAPDKVGARPAPHREKSDLETWFVDRESMASGLIVPMQTNGPGTPIFAVPGADGSVLSLQTLGRALDGVRPMFAFEAVGLDGKREPLASIRKIAAANIEALATMRDSRCVNLLGYSNGAVVAFEMARQLLERKIVVERLVLVDRVCPGLATRSQADEIAAAFVNVIEALGGQLQLDLAEFGAIPAIGRADYLYELMKRNGFGMPREHFMLAYRLALANDKACRSYRPGKIRHACDTFVVRATQCHGDEPPDLGWNKLLATPAVCVDIDADHLSVVGKEASAHIAQLFRIGACAGPAIQ